ncbi:FAD-dependent oxidoreductase [Nitrospira defluvii]|uniref:FAD-binding FR-type domain-containing protein n=1 Tax=Nitrospira defluvii TaxID=330214 RepID=A0ABN7M332_9BACT|nr:FAD-dependent oxidoreductase [Nitrospira defluvii]CAE6778217.1 FAD-binding FR-type domain-containing protein [Nitrospira defluvii]
MAVAKTARVVGTDRLGPDTLLLDLCAAEPVGFVGGQYLILDSRIVLPSGKAVKRAYSFLTGDAEQRNFQLAVKRIPDGPGSAFVHGLTAGTDISFSGPWGKFVPREGASGRTLILATDTGITAALGFLRATRFAPLLPQALLIWLRASAEYFLPDEFVQQQVPAACGEVRIAAIPAVGHHDRIPQARAILREVLVRGDIAQVFIAGDGAVNQVLSDDAMAAGVAVGKEQVESFFNMPKKSV